MRWRTRLLYKRIGVLAICLGLLYPGMAPSWAATPWYANNLLTLLLCHQESTIQSYTIGLRFRLRSPGSPLALGC